MKQKIAFLDRDGALIFEPQDSFQIDSLEKLRILDGVIEALQDLIKKGYKLVMVSNQNGVGTPSFLKENFEIPQNKMLEIFRRNGIEFYKIFICPHFPEDNCECRKPKIGMLKDFLKTENIDFEKSFMYGDRETDRQFAKNIKVRFVKATTNEGIKNSKF
ncbi:MAG: Histidinol-phosphatase / Imidazoleglycerol-phosphate dehydratase, imidazoleglycerol-phosphate dehydratase / histidinol-phosphatase [Candidatus Peregrinibacteria bacterium GW2011_GWF2_33_10]|nr:MAG: Histidinol-phosphatase / Imidazoleglycerol-phosphate dehydratase, imidazoleglycerol-phosphate dehydratase / histidinol-phosphatase [Candidatus Peregrinibacteria bacterium GW2011_GWF2_33_10]OGJ44064.1 MAG: histidinol-phosphatase [Candidatus Peregrinibacteria bacterium RIFOXYA2_FULL_33_21]OGJ45709.1 MAG: histidinol-phosphatase [Candidatus Peregrinibacteria bacterium RIFOXYA12_FULL_33_12]OGJ51411.1 MAG: histidinol-phosphatase [Candidatus Peregrinibacteria bacterium RIFOXYB2_FULL_33_20]